MRRTCVTDAGAIVLALIAMRATPDVLGVGQVRLRWIGHQLRAECEITVADTATVVTAHAIAHDAEHRLIHSIARLTAVVVHAEPHGAARAAHHEQTLAHR